MNTQRIKAILPVLLVRTWGSVVLWIALLMGMGWHTAPAVATPFVYVTNAGSNNVSVIDAATNKVVGTILVEPSPRGVVVTPDGKYAYVMNGGTTGTGNVSVIDAGTNKVVGTIPVGGMPYGVAVTPDGKYAYVTNTGRNVVSVINTATNTVVGTIPVGSSPRGVAVTPDGKYAYVVNSGATGNVSVIDTVTNTVVRTIPTGADTTLSGIAITPDGKHAYIVAIMGTISVIDTVTNTVVGTIPGRESRGLLFGVAVTPDGKYAYVTNTFDTGSIYNGTVLVIDTATNTVVGTISVGEGHVLMVAITPDGKYAYVVSHGGHDPGWETGSGPGNVSVIDTATNTVVRTIPVGVTSWGAAITATESCPRIANWQQTTLLPGPRATMWLTGKDLTIVRGRAYVFGGQNANTLLLNDAYYSVINSDGSLGPWIQTTPLPRPYFDHVAVPIGNYLYMITGANGDIDVLYAPIQPDGTVGAWTYTAPLNPSRQNFAAAAYGNFIYASGGNSEGTVSFVKFTSVRANGSLNPWQDTTALPEPTEGHTMMATHGRLYVVLPNSRVYYAAINADGTVGTWVSTSPLPEQMSGYSSFELGGYIYLVGGTSTTTYSAQIMADGSLSAWQPTTVLPAPRMGALVSTYGNYVYVVGGFDRSNFVSSVLYSQVESCNYNYTSTVSKKGNGSGTVTSIPPGINCGAVCSASYPSGTVVTLTAAAADGSTFAGWSGGGCSGTGTCVFTMSADTSITANFLLKTYAISGRVTDSSNGSPLSGVTISSSPGPTTTTDNNGYYTLGGLQKATYVLTPNKSGYAFSPISRTLSLSSNLTNMNFQAAAIYSVKGRIIDEYGNPISGAMILTDTGQSVLTDSNGYFTIAVMAGKRTLTISKGGYTFAAPAALNVSANINNLNFKGYDKPPIVMMHGWNSDPDGTFKEGSGPYVPNALVQAGYHVEFARLETSAFYTPPIDFNVQHVMDAIQKAKDATGQPKVILIAHSMGGLVSRHYIESPSYRGDVLKLFTFGSPHSGTPLAVFGLRPGGPGITDMSEVGTYLFNLMHNRRDGVEYHLIGGDAPMDVVVRQAQCWDVDINLGWFGHLRWRWCTPEIRVPTWAGGHAADRNFWGWLLGNLIPGQDDAFIPTNSATGLGGGWLDRASTNEVHGAAFGCYTYFNHNGILNGGQDGCSTYDDADLSRSYYQCIKKVLVDKTTNTCGRWSTGSRVPTTAAAAVRLEAFRASVKSSSQSTEESPPSLEQHTPIATGTLLDGHKEEHTIRIEGGVTAFAAHWTSGSVVVTLIDPNGQTIDPAFAASHPDVVQYGADNSTAIYYFRNATAGSWQLLLKGGNDITAEGSDYSAFASLQSALTMSTQMDRDWYAPGDTAHISAVFSEAPSSANVTATLLYSNGSSNAVTLSPTGQGQYEASVAVADVPGYTRVRLVANGIKAGGSPFERGQDLLFQVSPHSAVLNGTYSDHPDPRPEDSSLYQALNITVGINSAINGQIGLAADLVDANGDFVAHSTAIAEVTVGTSTLVLPFSGTDIFAAQKNGPYHLTNLLLTDNREAALVITEAQDAYTTAVYDYRTFAERHNFPTASAGGPYSVDEGESITLTASGNDPENDSLTYAWDLNDDGIFETPGQSVSFSAAGINGPHNYIIRVQVTNSKGFSAINQTTVDVVNVAPVVQSRFRHYDSARRNTLQSRFLYRCGHGYLDGHC